MQNKGVNKRYICINQPLKENYNHHKLVILKRTLKLIGHYFRFNLSAGMAYKSAFSIHVFGMILNNSAFIIFRLILFDRIGGPIKVYGFTNQATVWEQDCKHLSQLALPIAWSDI